MKMGIHKKLVISGIQPFWMPAIAETTGLEILLNK